MTAKTQYELQPQAITAGQIRQVTNRISSRPEDRMRWVLEFVNSDLERFTPGDFLNAIVELKAFRNPIFQLDVKQMRDSATFTIPSPLFPSIADIRNVHRWFLSALKRYATDGIIEYDDPGEHTDENGKRVVHRTSYSLRRDPTGKPVLSFENHDCSIDCAWKLLHLLAEFGDLVRQCQAKNCGQWFLANRKDRMFCSDRCLNRAMTQARRARAPHAGKRGR